MHYAFCKSDGNVGFDKIKNYLIEESWRGSRKVDTPNCLCSLRILKNSQKTLCKAIARQSHRQMKHMRNRMRPQLEWKIPTVSCSSSMGSKDLKTEDNRTRNRSLIKSCHQTDLVSRLINVLHFFIDFSYLQKKLNKINKVKDYSFPLLAKSPLSIEIASLQII